jgi:hypothetical protein
MSLPGGPAGADPGQASASVVKVWLAKLGYQNVSLRQFPDRWEATATKNGVTQTIRFDPDSGDLLQPPSTPPHAIEPIPR